MCTKFITPALERSGWDKITQILEKDSLLFEIERQLAKTKQLKEHVQSNQQSTEHLLKALLHEAFEVGEGEVV